MPAPRKSHCIHGHALVEGNILYAKGKRIGCLQCKRDRAKAHYDRNRETICAIKKRAYHRSKSFSTASDYFSTSG